MDLPFVEATDSNWETMVVAQSKNLPVLVDFWAERCSGCVTAEEYLKRIHRAYGVQLEIATIHAYKNPAVSLTHRITSLPTFQLWKGGTLLSQKAGVQGGYDAFLKFVRLALPT